MLLTRSLPPQFLLPAWSVRQLAQASQRASKSYSTNNRSRCPVRTKSRSIILTNGSIKSNKVEAEDPYLKLGPRKPAVPEKEYVFERTFPTDAYREPKQTEPEQKEDHEREHLSLFDELFPEESQARRKREQAAEKRLDKLPAFNWKSAGNGAHNELLRAQKQAHSKEKRSAQYTKIPQRADPVERNVARYVTTRVEKPLDKNDIQYLKSVFEREVSAATLPSLLVINACSKNLEESDFFRLSSKGKHIEGWASGVIKVIPARDRNTLEKLGSYFVVCSNDAAARAYRDRMNALQELARSKKIRDYSGLPIPKGYLQKGEDPEKLLQGFSLAPAHGAMSMKLLQKPYRPTVLRMLQEGGPAARFTKEGKAGEMVIFSLDMGQITEYDLQEALKEDGRRRNLHWKFGREEAGHIFKLDYDYQGDGVEEPGEGTVESVEAYRARKKAEYRRPSRYVISFADRNEARRFQRDWHRRPLPLKRQHKPGDEPIPIVNAEILW